MINYKSIVKNCKFILLNLDSFDKDTLFEFNASINYFVDRVIEFKFNSKFKKFKA